MIEGERSAGAGSQAGEQGEPLRDVPLHDVVVVGAGIVGAVTALLLANAGFDVAVIERREPVAIAGRLGVDPRTLAISPGSQRLIESVGAWPAVATAMSIDNHLAQPYLHMCVWDGDGGGELRFTVDDITPLPPVLGHIVPQSTLTTALWRALHARPHVRVYAGGEVQALLALGGAMLDGAAMPAHRLQLGGAAGAPSTNVDARLVVAADGAASPVRAMAGGSVVRKDTGQIAIATIVAHEQPHEDTAWQVFRATGPLAFLPLPDGHAPDGRTPDDGSGAATGDGRVHRSSIVWSCDADYGEELLQLDDAAFIDALASAFGDRLGRVTHVDNRTRIPLAQQQAVRYQPRPGVLLIGDAAHVIHPLAGQGVNLGLRDARILAEVLGGAGLGAGFGAAASPVPGALRADVLGNAGVLAQYELRTRTVNAMALGFMAGIQRLFATDHPLLRTLRSGGMRAVGRLAPMRRQLAREAMGQGLLAQV